jgi:hypothetical protein
MTFISYFALQAPPAASPIGPPEDLAHLLVWVAVPAAILGALAAAAIKRAVLSRPRFRGHRPGLRTFVWVGLADLVTWAILWPALFAVRLQGVSSHRSLWVFALLMVVALGYVANRYGFGRVLDPSVAGSVRGTMLAELFTILMPVLAVVFGIVIFFALGMWGNG